MQTRRHFLKSAGTLAAASIILPGYALSHAKLTNPGVQLYSFRNEMLKDAGDTLRKIADLGIKQIESAGSAKGYYYGLSSKEMKQVCADLGMTLRSGHVQLDKNWDSTMNAAAEAGQEYLICSSMPIEGQTTENYEKVAAMFNSAGAACKKLNIKFGYHNHDYEFNTDKGKVLYDVLLDNTDPSLVHMELDLGWVVATGHDPLEYFRKYPGRFPLWHLKDMNLQKKESTELGKGGLDIKAIVAAAEQSGLKYFFIEQEEYSHSAFESMKQNMAYLKRME